MKKYYKIIFTAVICNSCMFVLGQNNYKTYNFIEYQFNYDSTVKPTIGGMNFSYKRIFRKDSTFQDKGLFSKDTLNKRGTLTSDLFKVKNGKWYVRINSQWIIYFNAGKQVSCKIKINGNAFRLMWKETNFVDNNLPIYLLDLKPIGISISGIPAYFFTSTEGIIAISGHDSFLIRYDKKYIKFTAQAQAYQ